MEERKAGMHRRRWWWWRRNCREGTCRIARWWCGASCRTGIDSNRSYPAAPHSCLSVRSMVRAIPSSVHAGEAHLASLSPRDARVHRATAEHAPTRSREAEPDRVREVRQAKSCGRHNFADGPLHHLHPLLHPPASLLLRCCSSIVPWPRCSAPDVR